MSDGLLPEWSVLVEWFAVLLALGYVWLAARQNIWCWLCAFVGTALYTWLYWQNTLPFQSGLNIYYMLMAIYGWYQWRGQSKQALQVEHWPLLRHLVAIVLLSGVSWALVQFSAEWFDSDFLYLDVFISIFSVFTTVLVAHKVLENWWYWMLINSAIVYLTYSKGMYPTALLHVAYLGLAVYGYVQWQRSRQSVDPDS